MDINEILARAVEVATALVEERGQETGAKLGEAVRKELPRFSWSDTPFRNLRELLEARSPALVIVGRRGQDVVWELSERIPDEDLDRILLVDRDASQNVVSHHLKQATFTRFRSCADTSLDLEPLTVLVGPNGAGKSTLLQGLFLAAQATQGNPARLFTGPRSPVRLRTHGAHGAVRLELRDTADHRLVLTVDPDVEGASPVVQASHGDGASVASSVWPALLLRLRPELLARPAPLDSEAPRLSHDGSGLSAVIAELATGDAERLREIVDHVRAAVPQVRDVRTRPRFAPPWARTSRPSGIDSPEVMLWHLEVLMSHGSWVPADLLSEGTLLVLGLHVVLGQRHPPRLLLLDDIDRGLHPTAQKVLAEQIQAIAARGDTRIVASTHSPFILHRMDPGCVRVVNSVVSGATTCRRLTNHPQWSRWSDTMSAGEFWTWVGDDGFDETLAP